MSYGIIANLICLGLLIIIFIILIVKSSGRSGVYGQLNENIKKYLISKYSSIEIKDKEEGE
jgi:hypothetical protein